MNRFRLARNRLARVPPHVYGGCMNILVLGETNFVGRHIVAELPADRHEVAILTRGKTNRSCFRTPLILSTTETATSRQSRRKRLEVGDALTHARMSLDTPSRRLSEASRWLQIM